jgi:biopolymer transport protein ExbD
MAHAQTHDDDAIYGINVTPLVDIMLVLLIIFMVATQLDQPHTLGVELPHASTAGDAPLSSLSIVIAKDGGLRVNGRESTLTELEASARRATTDAQAVVSADRGVPYERVVGVVDAVRRGGVHKLALAAELPEVK